MREIRPRKTRVSTLVASLIVLGFAVLLYVTAWSSGFFPSHRTTRQQSASQARNGAQLELLPAHQSLASGFTVTSIVGSQGEGYQVTLKNEYSQSVVAFDLGVGRGRMTRDLIYQDEGIRPGTTWTEYHAYEPDMATQPLTVFGVVFEDGGGDGRPQSVKAIKDMRLGTKMQLTQFAPILERAIKLARTGARKPLDTLQSETDSLQVDPAHALPPHVRFGLHNEKQRLLAMIRELRVRNENSVSVQQTRQSPLEQQLMGLTQDNERRKDRLANRLIQ